MEAKANSLSRLCLPSGSEEVFQCPSCNARLKRCEVAQHCEEEIERLRQMQMKAVAAPQVEAAEITQENESTEHRRKPWSVFQKVQRNRHSRQKRIRKRVSPPTEHPCPICNITYPANEIQRHAIECIRRSSSATNGREDHSSDDDDDGEEYEEYEWAGQKRIRTCSLLQGGYASIGIGQNTSLNGSQQANEEEEDLNVDEDDTHIYGPPQYGETDVIPIAATENASSPDGDVTTYMRRLIDNDNATDLAEMVAEMNGVATPTTDTASVAVDGPTKELSSRTSIEKPAQHYQHVIEALKAKLVHYEINVQSKYKCLICLDDYRNPAISVSCWHVHCEECWLRSLGARKLCPQCNLITTPKDLRRIYM